MLILLNNKSTTLRPTNQDSPITSSIITAMAEIGQHEPTNNHLPVVLIFKPLTPTFHTFHKILTSKFRLLKPFQSSLPTDQFLAANADSITAILTFGPFPDVNKDLMEKLPKLQLVVAGSAGVNHIDLAECRLRGIIVCNVGDAFSDDVADYAVGLLIDVLRGLSSSDRYVRKGLWPVKGEFRLGSRVGGKRVGIIGLGSIGSRIAIRLEAFGCIISYHSRTRKPSVSYKYFSSVHDLATDSDVLVVSCALTSDTHHIVNRDVMLALGKDGIIINIGRGSNIDEKEMVRCLMEGEIGGAGLDVYENEPMVPEELFQMDNVVLCHHQAVSTPESMSGLLQTVVDNLEAFFSNRPLLTPVLSD